MKRAIWSCSVLAVAATSALAAKAQDRLTDGAAKAFAEEIIVTSRKLDETTLQTPAAVSVLTAGEFERNNITNANQLNGILPGLVQAPGSGGGGATVLRGLGSSGSTFSVEASVAEYIDGVYLGHYRDYIAPLYDISRIEVIKGTQSTLLGKNASVGAVSIITNRPEADTSYLIRYTHSSAIDGDRVDGYYNASITPKLKARFSFLYSDDDGYYGNSYNGVNGQSLRDASGRLEVEYSPVERSSILVMYQHDDRRAVGQNFQVLSDGGGVLAARAAASGQTGFRAGAILTQSDASAAIAGVPAGSGAFDRQKTDRVNLIASTGLGDYTVTAQTSYIAWATPQDVDLDYLAANFYDRFDIEKSRTFAQELRILSPQDWKISYLGGVYYYDNTWDLERVTSANAGTIPFPLSGIAQENFRERTRTFSAFAAFKAALTAQVKLIGGFRYTDEVKTASVVRFGSGNIGGASGSLPPIPFAILPRKTSTPIDGDIGLEYRPVSRLLLYATYGKGSKSGGFQEGAKTAAGSPFAPETAYSAEVGAKLDGGSRGYLTAALFDTEVHSFQVVTTRLVGAPPVSQSTVGNADVRSRGVELAGALSLAPHLKLDGGVVYDHAEFTKAFLPVAAKGDRLVKAPVLSGQIGLRYEHALTPALRFSARPSVQFASSALTQPIAQSSDAPIAAAHQVLDLALSVANPAQGWTISLLGSNLTNEHFVTFASSVGAGGSALGQRAYYGSFNRPRVIGLQLSFSH